MFICLVFSLPIFSWHIDTEPSIYYNHYTPYIDGRCKRFMKNFSKTFQKFISALKEDILMDNKNLFSIGEIAKTVGITRKIILNYEAKGLIQPDKKIGTSETCSDVVRMTGLEPAHRRH